jgi:hypothetical protein
MQQTVGDHLRVLRREINVAAIAESALHREHKTLVRLSALLIVKCEVKVNAIKAVNTLLDPLPVPNHQPIDTKCPVNFSGRA